MSNSISLKIIDEVRILETFQMKMDDILKKYRDDFYRQ
jgi:hypothetical protein